MRCAVFALFGFVLAAHGEHPATVMKGAELHLPTQLKWQDAPASLPKGAQIALLEGDPAKEGPFVVRFKFPDNYIVAPHTHPKRERVTVLRGTLHVGMGKKFDRKRAFAMPAGAYGSWPENMAHFGWFSGETIIQLHGIGPWAIHYIDPSD